MVIVKSLEEIAIMRHGGKILAGILGKLKEETRAGIKTCQLDNIMLEEAKKHGVVPSFKNYHGFPANLCVSINDEIVHGIPGERVIEEGDIVSLDAGVIYKGFHTDSAITVAVGNVSKQAMSLIEVTKASLDAGISRARRGAHIKDISTAVQIVLSLKVFQWLENIQGME